MSIFLWLPVPMGVLVGTTVSSSSSKELGEEEQPSKPGPLWLGPCWKDGWPNLRVVDFDGWIVAKFWESWKMKGAAPMIHLVGWISVGLCFSWIHWLMIRWSRFGWIGFSWIFSDHSWFFRDRLRNSSELNQLPPRPCGIECAVWNVSDSLTLNQTCSKKTPKTMHFPNKKSSKQTNCITPKNVLEAEMTQHGSASCLKCLGFIGPSGGAKKIGSIRCSRCGPCFGPLRPKSVVAQRRPRRRWQDRPCPVLRCSPWGWEDVVMHHMLYIDLHFWWYRCRMFGVQWVGGLGVGSATWPNFVQKLLLIENYEIT